MAEKAKTIVVALNERKETLAEGEQNGWTAIRGGLGVADGNYLFQTPDNEEICGIRMVKRNSDGQGFMLTCVAGTLSNGKVSKVFGVDEDSQILVVLDTFWEMAEPNNTYDVVIKNGRVSSFVEAESGTLEHEEEAPKEASTSAFAQ